MAKPLGSASSSTESSAVTRRRYGRAARGVLSWLASVTLGLLLLEGSLRLAGRDPVFINPLNSFHEGHPRLGWLGAPGLVGRFIRPEFDVTIETGPLGFRASGSRTRPAQDALAVSFLGDSFTWGWGVSQGEVLTDQLQDRLGPAFRVRNRGINAWGTVQEALLLEELMQREPPDVVAVMFFRNDLANNLDGKGGRRPFVELVDDGERVLWRGVTRPLGSGWRDIRRRSAALTLLAEGWNRARTLLEAPREAQPPKARPAPTAGELRAFEASLARMAEACRGRCALGVIYIADPSELIEPAEPSEIARGVAAVCGRLGVEFLDLSPRFLAAARDSAEPLYFPLDHHWTPAGHAVAADALAPWLASAVSEGPTAAAVEGP